MKKAVLCVLLLLVLSFQVGTHPLKMAYTSVKYDPGKKVFKISHTIFQDDFEYELQKKYGFPDIDVFKTRENKQTRKAYIDYFDKHFSIDFNGKSQQLVFKEVEDKGYMGLAVWFETSTVDHKLIKTVSVQNTILLASFKDQVNMFHLNINDQVKRTIKFDRKKTKDSLSL
ncbi:hypothetical protein RCC89_12685 [Cytophagaceae bacterium ABcell3]|nr:hypothetical protein RCC89_12685 [Cytophagaceae bacterium ABcell3]